MFPAGRSKTFSRTLTGSNAALRAGRPSLAKDWQAKVATLRVTTHKNHDSLRFLLRLNAPEKLRDRFPKLMLRLILGPRYLWSFEGGHPPLR